MRMKLNYRIVVFAFAIVFGLFFSAPSLLQMQDGKKVTLGLDLQGGLHMLLGVKTEEATKSRIKSIAASIKHFSDRKDILIDELKFNESSVSFSILDVDDVKSVKEFLGEMAQTYLLMVKVFHLV
jgi:preprotein translocase subunit SecD